MRFRLPDRHVADLRLAAKVAIAAGAAFVLATLFALPQGYWSVISALVVVQGSVGGTLIAAQERAIGTLVGAVIGGLAAFLHPHSLLTTSVTLTAVVAALAFAAAGRPALKLAPVTAAILLVATANQPDQLLTAAERILEVLLGSAVGIAATFLVFPDRLDKNLLREARATLKDLAAHIRAASVGARDAAGADAARARQIAIRTKLTALEKSIAEGRKAPGGRAVAEARSALVRTIWRVRNDEVSIDRALAYAPDAARKLVGPAAESLMRAAANLLQTLGDGRDPAADLAELVACRAALDDDVAHIREDGSTEGLDVAEAMPTLGLVFSLRNLAGNLSDLADRLSETREAENVE